MKADGSGTINFTYIEKDDIIKQKNNMVGNLPFIKEKIAEYFKAPNSYIQLSKIEKNPKDNTQSQVVIVISFTNINFLGEAKGFNGMTFNLSQTDTGQVFKNIIKPEFVKTNSVNQIYSSFNTEKAIKSSNGKLNGNSVTFFRGKEFIDGKSDINFIATLESGKNETSSKSGSNGDNEKSCGLFGMELPFVLFSGLLFFMSRKKIRN